MRKRFLSVVAAALLLSYSSINAQRVCGTNEVFLEQLKNDPDFAVKYKNIESFTSDYLKRGGSRNLVPQLNAGTALYTIPVVVHVVYNTAAQNVSDAQIQSQIDVLNKDYQLLNPDATSTPTPFKPLVADCKIQFCLAKRDPSGNASTGIVRKATTRTSFTTNDAVKKAANGDVAWDATKYLNIWVCNLSGGVLGYAQFPGGPAATDGVVITYTGFGTTGTAASPFNLGRTATHEVGHWLNLKHIWGDDGTACTGTDNVGDTPNQADENYGKPVFPIVSCSNGPNGDMFMNYMDYVDDAAMFMFSLGQRDRMYALFQSGGARASLLASQGCTAPGTVTCNVPAPTAGSITQTGATISWAAVTGAVSYDLQHKTSAASSYTTVAGLTATSYNLAGLTANTLYNYQVKTNCTGASSAYSTTASFTTLAAPACSDNYEPNNNSSTSTAITVNTPVNAIISSATDKDYFKFTNTSAARNIRVTLTNLPADYDVRLYAPSGSQIGISQNTGTASETITYNTSIVGTFRIMVSSKSGAFSATNCYTVEVDISSTSSFRTEKTTELFVMKDAVKVFPQPAKGIANLQFDGNWKGVTNVGISNQLGVKVGSVNLNAEGGFGKLDVSNLKPGMYYLRLSNGEHSVTQKLMVQK